MLNFVFYFSASSTEHDDQSNKRKVSAVFEDSDSEQESENEIKSTVDRIVEESEKADETNSESAVVDVLNSRLMTLFHQNLAAQMRSLQKVIQFKSPKAK